jgi:HD-like signal output (HDOD) protein
MSGGLRPIQWGMTPWVYLIGASLAGGLLVVVARGGSRRARPPGPAEGGSAAGSHGGPAEAPGNEARLRAATASAQATPAAWPGGSGGALPRALGAATLSLWRRAFGVTDAALAVPEGHEFAAEAIERALAGDALSERFFPRRPMLMPQLQAAANDPESPPTRLADIVAQDPVLTGDVLRLANSVFYRLSAEPVESLQRAVIVCGTDGLHSLAATALVQPVFRSGSHGHPRFAQLLWERCTRAAAAAEACARHWCPHDRQTAQLLPLLAALGPLVAYRIAEEAYKKASARPSAEALLALVLRHGPRIAARVAAQWQMPLRLVQALSGEQPADEDQAAALATLLRAWQAGELLATLTILADEQVLAEEDYRRQAAHAGIPEPLQQAIWERAEAGRTASV